MPSTIEDGVGKENVQPTCPAKPSRIPRPSRKAVLSVVQVQPKAECSERPPSQKGPASRTAASSGRPRSRVKAVPNFSKIHKKWEGTLQKVREENRRTPLVMAEFSLTPRGKFKTSRRPECESATPILEGAVSAQRGHRSAVPSPSLHKEEHGGATGTEEVSPKTGRRGEAATLSPDEEARPGSKVTKAPDSLPAEEEFQADPRSLQSILKGQPNVMVDRRATELGSTRCRDKYDFDSLLRLSVYCKRKPPATSAAAAQSVKGGGVSERIQELYGQVLRASLARSRLRVSKQEGGTKKELSDIKLNLDSEFSRVAESTPLSRLAPTRDFAPTPQQISFPALPQQHPQLTSSPPVPPQPPFTPTTRAPTCLYREPHHTIHKTTPIHFVTPLRATPTPRAVPLTVGARLLLHDQVGVATERHTFYEEEPELCSITRGIQPHVAVERRECSDPLAKVLDGPSHQNTEILSSVHSQRHFVPISQH